MPPTLTQRQFRITVTAALMAILLGALDQTIVSVAVPNIAKQLGGFEWMAWLISSYLIASTVVTPLYGKFSDLFGRRTVITLAIGIFCFASIGCAMAHTLPQLVVARVIQGIGGGGLISMAQSMIADVVPMRERGQFQVYVSSVWAGASVAGPVVGGVLTQYLSWPWIFWINVPLCLLALSLVYRTPAPARKFAKRIVIDWLGIVLLLFGLTALLIAITRVGQGVRLLETGNLMGFVVAAVLLTIFVRHEKRTVEPIIPIFLLRQPVVVMCCAILTICFFLFVALSVLIPLREQLVGGAKPGSAALAMLPFTLSNPISGFIAGRWIFRHGRVVPVQRFGAISVVVFMIAMAFTPPSQPLLSACVLTMLGIGFGLQMPMTLMVLQNSVPQSLLGTATSLSAFFRLLGGAIGIAVLSSVVLALLHGTLPADVAARGLDGISSLLGNMDSAALAAAKASDSAFRDTILLGALIALISVWCVSKLPDVRLDAAAPPAALDVE